MTCRVLKYLVFVVLLLISPISCFSCSNVNNLSMDTGADVGPVCIWLLIVGEGWQLIPVLFTLSTKVCPARCAQVWMLQGVTLAEPSPKWQIYRQSHETTRWPTENYATIFIIVIFKGNMAYIIHNNINIHCFTLLKCEDFLLLSILLKPFIYLWFIW